MIAPRGIERRRFLAGSVAVGALSIAGCAGFRGDDEDGLDGAQLETVAEGLAHPWAMAFLPDESRLLVTERDGHLTLVDRDDGDRETVDGTPAVLAEGQGGMLDVALGPDYRDESWLYLTYAGANDAGESTTHLGRGRLDADAAELEEFEKLHAVEPFDSSTAHYGSRVVFGEDDTLFLTVGDRASKEFGPDHYSQDTTNEIGATLRLTPDGEVPDDNPFVDDADVEDSIYSYGHRNAQGMTIHPETGELWQSEHGEEDGDELNVIEPGGNYGWPIAHTGCQYGTDDPVGDDPFDREDVVDPVYYWECTTGGFPPAGMTFYDGEAFPEWEGDLFVGNLGGAYLGRFAVDGHDVEELAPLLDDRGWRIRDVAVAPDTGHLYVAVDAADAPIVRLVPD